ncbi:hypothetical protein MP228_000335 [Amoeboaphelidium protococcarum]|nr:hypothetical protein MP228_000335 [Amoeboaphelidium protococcarum]
MESGIVNGRYYLQEMVGEGSYGQVWLSLDMESHNQAALKIFDITSADKPTKQRIQNEIKTQKCLGRHNNIVQFYQSWLQQPLVFCAIEYAAGGELFDKIQPDVGLNSSLAHHYFQQLISGLEHMHKHGVCHRDIKPENLLLDSDGQLKIADFGFATFYIVNGVVQRKSLICGSRPYCAPEVFFENYNGQLVDIWSCGIVLLVMLTGQLPWTSATEGDQEFERFVNLYYNDRSQLNNVSPFPRLDSEEVFQLLCAMLSVQEEDRWSVQQIKSCRWFRQRRLNPSTEDITCSLLSQMDIDDVMASQDFIEPYSSASEVAPAIGDQDFALSQPAMMSERGVMQTSAVQHKFSQSDAMSMDGFLGTLRTQMTTQGRQYPLGNRLTRFYAQASSIDVIAERLCAILSEYLIQHRVNDQAIEFDTADRRKIPLKGQIRLQKLSNVEHQRHQPNPIILVNFVKTRGDPMEFKRLYYDIKTQCKDLICKIH